MQNNPVSRFRLCNSRILLFLIFCATGALPRLGSRMSCAGVGDRAGPSLAGNLWIALVWIGSKHYFTKRPIFRRLDAWPVSWSDTITHWIRSGSCSSTVSRREPV